jgi:acyl transferase domain-containing protein/thioesterase domain-containing protein/acyl carrier protein
MMSDEDGVQTDIAIVGMAGRFPGACDVDALWSRVVAGDDCLTSVDVVELVERGVPPMLARSPTYVRRTGMLDDVAGFDHEFFGIGGRDAAVMDPQHRHFLECAWEALESAAIVPERFDGAIGVFGGCGMDTYLIHNLLTNRTVLPQLGWFLLRHTGNDKDFFTNNVAYRLDLRGPAVNVQTACSTSLVAVHLAVQSLLAFETDAAIAGGATIEFPHGVGYEFHEGEILAPDGVCRAFDARSAGTVLTSGVAVVAMRRLVDALADNDPVLAVIKGTAINNDGSRKVSFLAPSVDGHADVVREALTVAGLSARDLQLFEAHGTGTAVGDPIEIAAAAEAFRTFTPDRNYCRVTSTKPNIGHLDTAAGAASLIKVVQALRHRTLPPLANYTAPSPLIDLEHSPFLLSGTADEWPGDVPRRAAISSLGVGGTNAHVVVEEAPNRAALPAGAPEQVLALSAMNDAALDAAAVRLADHLSAHPELDLADVAHTLAAGRRAMTHRRVVTATDVASAPRLLREADAHRSAKAVVPDGPVRLGFMFPGGGSQYVGMAAGLDQRFAVFHKARAEGVELVRRCGGPDLAPLLEPGGDPAGLLPPTASLPAVFITSIALARQWMAFGARPDLFVGHSLGEYAAAHLAGVMSFEDAVSLVVTRSALMERDSGTGAAMLAVPLAESEVRTILPSGLDIAAVNTDGECVVTGRADAIEQLAATLEARGAAGTVLALSAAAHSSLLDPMLDELAAAVGRVELRAPQIPYPSNLTGTWVTTEQATDPQYWASHTRSTVRFADCIRTAVAGGPLVLVELGPGQALSSFARRSATRPTAAIPSLRHPGHDIDDSAYTLASFARLWASGIDVDLDQFTGGDRRKLRLPTYAFQHVDCYIEPGTQPSAADERDQRPQRIDDLDDACWTVEWVQTAATAPGAPAERDGWWMVVGDSDDALAESLAEEMRNRQLHVLVTAAVDRDEPRPDLLGVVVVAPEGSAGYDDVFRRWYIDALDAIKVLGAQPGAVRMTAVVRQAMPVGGLAERAVDAMALGVTMVGGREYPNVAAQLVDVDDAVTVAAIVDEILDGGDVVAALRGAERFVPDISQVVVPRPDASTTTFRDGGTYVITGGLGGIGHALACHLATRHRANLVLVSSAEVPERDARDRWLATHAYDDPTSRRIRRLTSLEQLGTKVAVVVADMSDRDAVRDALDEAERLVGSIDGAVHTAGVLRDALIELATTADHEAVLGAKAHGALVLADELGHRGAELLVLVSSTSTVLAPAGQSSYVGANAVLDALAGRRGGHAGLRVATINFGLWSEVGIASDIARRARLSIGDGEAVEHPVFSERRRERDGTTVLFGRVDADHHWVAGEHRTAEGVAVYPGTGHLHLMTTAAELAGLGDVQLVDVELLAPIVVPEGTVITVRVVVSADGYIEISSDGGRGEEWTLHSQAATEPRSDDPPLGDPLAELAELHLGDVELLTAQRVHMAFGPRWDAVVEARRGDGVIVACLSLPSSVAAEAEMWSPHPALVDVATAAGIALAPASVSAPLYVPTRYGRVRTFRAMPPDVIVRASEAAETRDDRLCVDLTVVDLAGEPILDITGLELLGTHDHLVFGDDEERATASATAPNLVELADELGLRPDEGDELVERLVASDLDRMIGSTIALDALIQRVEEPSDVEAAPGDASGRADSLDQALATMWIELLGLDDVGPDDDFFDIGGHSLIAIRLMSRIHQELGVRLQLSTIFDAPTVRTLAAHLRNEYPSIDARFEEAADGATDTGPVGESPGEMTQHLVPISTRGEGRPLYVVHGAGGNILFLARFGRAMSQMRPVYGFQAHGVDGHDVPDSSIEEMVTRYVEELRAHAPGPYLLGGYSGGGTVALEMSKRLQALGDEVEVVVLFDSPTGRISLGRRVHFQHLVRNTLHYGPQPLVPIVTSRLQENRIGRTLFFGGRKSAHQESHERNYSDQLAHGFHDLYDHFGEMVEGCQPGVYDVDAILVKAQLRWPLMPPDYGWQGHIEGRFQSIVAPGDHESMFHGEQVQIMVARLAPLLAAYDD